MMIALVFIFLSCCALGQAANYEVVYEWKELDYQYPSESLRQSDLDSGRFIPSNNAITGIKVFEDKVFLTVPRWKEGVPSTLNVLSNTTSRDKGKSPKLIPFPSWEIQGVGNCQNLQYVQSMEIDQDGLMWIVDVGRVNTFTKPISKCPAKLIVYDLKLDEIVRTYEFPEEVAPRATNFLNDLVIECPGGAKFSLDNCYAFITDAKEAAIVVYDYVENSSWRFQHQSMKADPSAIQFEILDQSRKINTSVDGIALSPISPSSLNRTLFFCPLSSYHLYSVDTAVLKDQSSDLEGQVRDLGNKTSQSDGLAMSNSGILYYGLLTDNSVYSWNISTSFDEENQELVAKNDQELQWVDTFGFDHQGYLWFVTNKLHTFFTRFDKDEVNFRVARIYVESASYLHQAVGQMVDNGTSVVNQDASPQIPRGLMHNSSVYAHAFPHVDSNSTGEGNLTEGSLETESTAVETSSKDSQGPVKTTILPHTSQQSNNDNNAGVAITALHAGFLSGLLIFLMW